MNDQEWLNEYIGIPYVGEGRSRDGLDCYGLVLLIYKDHFGIELPDWSGVHFDLKLRGRAIDDVVCSGDFTVKSQPCNGDFVVCYRHRSAYHMGLYFYGGVIHCAQGLGCIYQPLSRFQADYSRIEYGSWQP